MEKWKNMSIFGEFDTGSNRSYYGETSSDDDMSYFGETFPEYKNTPPTDNGILTYCYCGGKVVVMHHTFGVYNGQKFYSCVEDNNVSNTRTLSHWSSIIEEIDAVKTKLGDQEANVEIAAKKITELKKMVADLQNTVDGLIKKP
ncbi:unnamed protein product [Arabis nemorensis]|uniref:Zinc finger GRF-type domain-containing protein n=1 Tax=Arabis nemorensis TaxID=586526 RepID=A0A565BV24_9BRAS|nr:unnamed protein product [Arabis nemorensis]